jgi:hypothetical protein
MCMIVLADSHELILCMIQIVLTCGLYITGLGIIR